MAKHLLLVGSYTAAIYAGLDMGFRITHLEDVKAVRPYHVGLTPRMILTDLADEYELFKIAAAIHSVEPIDLVVSMHEKSLSTAAMISDYLGVPGLNHTSVERTRDKAQMRVAMADAGLASSVPFMVLTDDRGEALRWAADVGYPVISKPRDGAGSRNVCLHATPHDLASLPKLQRGELLLEKYIGGSEHSMEAVSFHGQHFLIAVTDKLVSDNGHFVEMGHSQPSLLGQEQLRMLEAELFKFLDIIGVTDGTTHTEVKIDDGRIYIVESHTRPGGDRLLEMTRVSTGVDVAHACLAAFAGHAPDPYIPTCEPRAVVSRYFSLRADEIDSVDSLDAMRAHPAVLLYDFPYGAGDIPPRIVSSSTRHGYVMCHGATVQEAANISQRLLDSVKVRYKQ